MTLLSAALLLLFNSAALFLIALGLPGTWLILLATTLVAWWRSEDGLFSTPTLIVLAAIALLAEILDLAAAAAGARRFGGSRAGAWGGLLGGILGALFGTPLIPIPVLGTILAGCAGAFVGALLAELAGGKSGGAALRSGTGAGLGRLAGTAVKLAAGLLMWVIVAVALLVP